MDRFAQELNGLLVDAFRSILKIEEEMVQQMANRDLTINELHLLEAVAKGEAGSSISDIAADLGITLPSVTVAINKLAKKGYVEKIKSVQDGRQVLVQLTRLGRKVNAGHLYFHENMVRNISKGMSEDEKEVLVKGMTNLNMFFQRKLGQTSRLEQTQEESDMEIKEEQMHATLDKKDNTEKEG